MVEIVIVYTPHVLWHDRAEEKHRQWPQRGSARGDAMHDCGATHEENAMDNFIQNQATHVVVLTTTPYAVVAGRLRDHYSFA